jgi:hypothetical protein
MSEETMVAPKKRGRPLGAIREVYFTIGAVSDGDLIMKQVPATRGDGISADDMRNEARRSFFTQFNVEPEIVFGPFFEAQLAQTAGNKKESIRIAVEDINYTRRKAQAIYNGWYVVARYIEDDDGLEREDVVEITFKKEVSPGEKPKGKPHPTLKLIAELQMLDSSSEMTA